MPEPHLTHLAVTAVLFPSSSLPRPRRRCERRHRPAGTPGCASPPVSELHPRASSSVPKSVRHPGALTPPNRDGGGPDPPGCVDDPPRAHGTASPCGRRPWRWRWPDPHGAPRQFPDPGQLIRRHSPGLVDPAALAPQPRPATVEEPASGRWWRPSPTVPLSI